MSKTLWRTFLTPLGRADATLTVVRQQDVNMLFKD